MRREYEGAGRERGSHICNVCTSTCCSAARYLVQCLVDIGEIRPVKKVRGIGFDLLFSYYFRTLMMLLDERQGK